jgi:hypothetical protein
MQGAKILPGTGRGTARSAVEGPRSLRGGLDPSVSASRCHQRPGRTVWGTVRFRALVPGRICK